MRRRKGRQDVTRRQQVLIQRRADVEELSALAATVTGERDWLRQELARLTQPPAPDMAAPDTGSLFDVPASGVPVPAGPLPEFGARR
jgi:hypothetical protein